MKKSPIGSTGTVTFESILDLPMAMLKRTQVVNWIQKN